MNSMAVPHQYRKTSIETSSPEKLLLMLYGGAINFLNQAIAGLEARDHERVNKMLVKSQAIIEELMVSLNMDYEVSQRLWSLYDYFLRRLVEANVKKEREPIEEVLGDDDRTAGVLVAGGCGFKIGGAADRTFECRRLGLTQKWL